MSSRRHSPLVMGRQSMCSWFCRGILHGSWRWAEFPSRSQYHRPGNVSAGILADSRSSQPPCAQHRALSLRAQHPLCSDLWPSCFQHQTVRTRSCPVWRFDRRDRSGRSPWYRVRDPPGWHGEHICFLETKKGSGWLITWTKENIRNKRTGLSAIPTSSITSYLIKPSNKQVT